MTELPPIQGISPVQWEGIKNTVAALEEASAHTEEPIPEEWADLVSHWRRLLVAASGNVQPFPVTEHFLSLLQMYLDGAPDDGTQLGTATIEVMRWAQTTIDVAAAQFDLQPQAGSGKCCWIVVGEYDELVDKYISDDDEES